MGRRVINRLALETEVKIRIAPEAVKRMKGTVRRITSRTWGASMAHRMDKLNRFSVGWVAYFGLADTQRAFGEIDRWSVVGCDRSNGCNGRPPRSGTPCSRNSATSSETGNTASVRGNATGAPHF